MEETKENDQQNKVNINNLIYIYIYILILKNIDLSSLTYYLYVISIDNHFF